MNWTDNFGQIAHISEENKMNWSYTCSNSKYNCWRESWPKYFLEIQKLGAFWQSKEKLRYFAGFPLTKLFMLVKIRSEEVLSVLVSQPHMNCYPLYLKHFCIILHTNNCWYLKSETAKEWTRLYATGVWNMLW